MRAAGYDVIATQPFDISMNSHMRHRVAGRPQVSPRCALPTHDVENLWFSASSSVLVMMNPALTIAAQALRSVAESSLAS